MIIRIEQPDGIVVVDATDREMRTWPIMLPDEGEWFWLGEPIPRDGSKWVDVAIGIKFVLKEDGSGWSSFSGTNYVARSVEALSDGVWVSLHDGRPF